MAELGGFTGKILRVDLSTGEVTSEDTMQYKDYLGGSGLGYKVLWDEVPAGTKAWDPENRLIFGVGPLTGTGAPLSGRVSVTSLWPPHPMELPATGHMGGHWGPELKFAGWDSLIIQGKADSPVWLYINDDQVELRDASQMWGNGIFRANSDIANMVGPEVRVAAIGQAGENLARLSCVICDRSHSAGGVGSVMGSKNLKAIGVKGTGSLKIAAAPEEWQDLVTEHLSLLGANSGGVVPRTPQPWAEYYGSTRWTAKKGLYWGAARPPIETGECPADDLNRIGMRTHKGILDHGAILGEKHTVRMGGCHACPIRCHVMTDVPSLEEHGVSRYNSNTCVGNGFGRGFFDTISSNSPARIEASQLGTALADDYGIWTDYGQITLSFRTAYREGIIEEHVDPDEFESIPWNLLEEGNPAFLKDIMRRWAFKEGQVGQVLADGPGLMEEHWPEMAEIHNKSSRVHAWKAGNARHHSIESGGQVGGLINLIYNRDPMCHTHTNFLGSGLPLQLQKEIGAEIFGDEDAVQARNNYGPVTPSMAKFAALSLIYMELHNSLTACNYTLPTWNSPRKDRNYRGDIEMDAKIYSAVTGDVVDREELEQKGVRMLALLRLLTARFMGETDLRKLHDTMPDWIFDQEGKVAFEPGSPVMDRDDMELAIDLLYDELGWDKETGMPTEETLIELGLAEAVKA